MSVFSFTDGESSSSEREDSEAASSSGESQEEDGKVSPVGKEGTPEKAGEGATEALVDKEKEDGAVADENDKNKMNLDPNTIELLGEDEADEKFGPKINQILVERWPKVLKKGLEKEVAEILVKKYPKAENCPLLVAPTLDAAVKTFLPWKNYKKD